MSGISPKHPIDVATRAKLRRKAVRFLAAILLPGAAFAWYFWYVSDPTSNDHRTEGDGQRPSPVTKHDQFRLPEIVPSRFRNASKDVRYVGNRVCRECHHDEHESYLKTTHSRSLAEVDVSREPPSGEFHHELSGRHYRIYRDGKTLRLREFIQDSEGQEVVLVDHAAQFALGSGNYARMYLVKVDDFLIEAPVTWYPRRNSWGMSAGYEKDSHQVGFDREVGWGCVHCHAGQVETIDGVDQRLKVTELAISCERCHGPGALHVKERKAELPVQGNIDDSIVNIRHLSRERQEDVCSQCHLSAFADVDVRGRSVADFRPGMRMSDFRVSYRVDRPEAAMTVSGQIEQMRLSRCYIDSKTMTCATCHNPHSIPESNKLAYYRNKCLTCHQTESCGLSVKERHKKQPKDNCIACHMPRGPTDIPHFSFTHHRVGIHAARPKNPKLTESDRLVPVGDVSHLPEHERLRLLGLANEMFAGKLAGGLNDALRDEPSHPALAGVFRERGRQILEKLRSRGLRDPEIETFFSRLNWRRKPEQCIAYAESALKLKHIAPAARRDAMYYLASSHFDQRRYKQALPYLKELVKMERSEISLMLLGICHQNTGNLPEALRLIKEAILAAPHRADLHSFLASIYLQMGKSQDAERHLKRASLLSRNVPQPQ
jgi:hypothetical protein